MPPKESIPITDESVATFCAMTCAPDEVAHAYLNKCRGDVTFAVNAFMDDQHGHHEEEEGAAATKKKKTGPIATKNGHEDKDDVPLPRNEACTAEVSVSKPGSGPNMEVRVHCAWSGNVHEITVRRDCNVRFLKDLIAVKELVPAMRQTIVYRGKALPEGEATLSDLGLTSDTVDVACLYGRRQTDGPLKIKWEKEGKSKDVEQGEWSENTTVADLKSKIFKIYGKTGPVSKKLSLVFNALTLHDNDTLGEYFVFAGATIHAFEK